MQGIYRAYKFKDRTGIYQNFFTVLKKNHVETNKMNIFNAIKIIEMISIRIHANINNKFSK